MTHWYHADANGQRHGPFTAGELAAQARLGRLGADTLVWRDGLEDWQPLSTLAAELDVPVTTMAPAVATEIPDGHAPYAPPSADLAATQVVAGGHVVHGGLWKRFAAAFIDNFITTIISYALIIPLMMIGVAVMGAGGTSESPLATGLGIASMLVMYPILLLAPCVYFGWMQSSSLQASLGKLSVGVKVVRTDGQRIGFWRGFLRSLASVVFSAATCGLGVLVSALMVAFTERKQALHDMVCDTLVVDRWAFTGHPERQREELGVVTVVILVLAAVSIVGVIALYAFMGAMMLGNLPS